MHIADKDQSAQGNTTAKTATQTSPYQQQPSLLQQQSSPTQHLSELEKDIIKEEQCIDEQTTTELEDDDGTFHIHTSEKYDKTAIHDEYKTNRHKLQNNTEQLH